MNALFVVIDERSMCDCYQLGIIENNCRNYAFKGRNKHLSFGGIPFVIVIGDDFKLPPLDPGAFPALESKIPSKIKNKKHPNVIPLYNNGRRMFKYLGEDSWSLQRKHRILDNETQLEKTLLGVRGEKHSILEDADAEHLLQYHLQHFTPKERKELYKDALFLSATKNEVNNFNLKCLAGLSSPSNPVAKLHSKTCGKYKRSTTTSHYDKDRNPEYIRLTTGARVFLNGWNPAPSWGLYHGSIGTIKDIVFNETDNPNDKDLPLYVVVDFEHYKGPIFFQGRPTYVPIPTYTRQCDLSYGDTCCERTNIPLQLAFGKTIHTFQGQSAGITQPGKPENQFKRIIVDPGNRKFESHNVGTFYTLLSRITTLGDPNDKMSSAIYFVGENFSSIHRIQNIRNKVNSNELYEMIKLRDKWVEFLENNTNKQKLFSVTQIKNTFGFANSTRYSGNMLKQFCGH